ncbi:MAG: outer membrane protein assembly factor BamA, partial [Myxococcota bacterium]|nr:outer membrane protein assembly factor BamA [Myxococcota bacterium]
MNSLEGARSQHHFLYEHLRMLALWLVLLVTCVPSLATAESLTIEKVDVKGSLRVEKKTILNGLETKEGAVFSEEAVTRDLRKIWDQGFFRDVSFHREETKDGLSILIKVREKPAIRKVIYRGNDSQSEEDLGEVVDVKPLTILNVELLKANVQKIKDLYKDKGFYLADVAYKTEAVGTTGRSVDVVFEIEEGLKVTVRQVAFIGNKELSDSLLKSVLQVREGNEFSFLSKGGTFKEEHFQTDLMRLQAIYYDHGFVAVKVGQPTIALSPDKRFIYITVPIDEGLQYDIGKISFAGEFELEANDVYHAVDEELLRGRMRTETGERFTRTGLFEDINRLTDAYKNRGYAYANVTPNSTLNPETQTVDLEMMVERGELVYVERIDIIGNTRTRDKVIRREMRLFEGELYSELAVKSSKARIFQLGFFETVEITTSPGSEMSTVKLNVEIKEKSTGTFQVGAGFSSVESFIATAQISQNNFLGTGQSLSLSAQLSFGDFARQLATV